MAKWSKFKFKKTIRVKADNHGIWELKHKAKARSECSPAKVS